MDFNLRAAEAFAQIQHGAVDAGLATLYALWDEVPQRYDIGVNISVHLAALGRYEEAAAVCRRGRATAANPWGFVKNYAVVMAELGRHEEAEAACFDLIESGDPVHGGLEAVLNLARLRLVRDELEGAVSLLLSLESSDVREWALTKLLGLTRNFSLDDQRRISWLDSLIACEPGHDDPPISGPVTQADVVGDPTDPKGVAAILRRHGCVILRDVYDPAALAAVAQRLDCLAEEERTIGHRAFAEITGGPEGAAALVPEPVWTALAEHFGQRPILSMANCWGRHVGPNQGEYLHWHQDVARIYTNCIVCWTPMDVCGADAPGLELAARRVRRLLDKDVGMNAAKEMQMTQEELAAYAPPETRMIPLFAPGDCAMFFTSQAHRTHVAPGMTKVRRSLEFRFVHPIVQ